VLRLHIATSGNVLIYLYELLANFVCAPDQHRGFVRHKQFQSGRSRLEHGMRL